MVDLFHHSPVVGHWSVAFLFLPSTLPFDILTSMTIFRSLPLLVALVVAESQGRDASVQKQDNFGNPEDTQTCSAPLELEKIFFRSENEKARRVTPEKEFNISASQECSIYMGESSIPHGGLGLYTAVDLPRGSPVGYPEIIIAMVDVVTNSWWATDDIAWNMDLQTIFAFEGVNMTELVYPGLGALANCHLDLVNVNHGKCQYDSAGLHRSKDYGAGAFTYYHGMPSTATKFIPKG